MSKLPRRRHSTQPHRPLPIDRLNPITRNLCIATYAGDEPAFFDCVHWRMLTDPYSEGSMSRRSITPMGRARGTNGGSYRNQWPDNTSGLSPDPDASGTQTLMTIFRVNQIANASLGQASSTDYWYQNNLGLTSTGYVTNSITNGPTLTSDAPVVVGGTYVVLSTNNGNVGRQSLYINGIKQASTGTFTGNGGKPTQTFTLAPGTAVDIVASFMWSRELLPAECVEVSNNPYSLFAAQRFVLKPIAAAVATFQKALYLNTMGQIAQSSGDLTVKPLVLLINGLLAQRVASEGTPVIVDAAGQLRTLKSSETLLI